MTIHFESHAGLVSILPPNNHNGNDEADLEGIDLLRALVEAESINPPGNTAQVSAVARTWLERAGLSFRIAEANPEKPNVVATIENGAGPHVILNAHLDTVRPGDGSAWTRPPLELTETEDRLYGLGTGNMKAAAAALMIAFGRLANCAADWTGRITLTLVADECVFGDDGTAFLLNTEPDLRGDMVICGEGPGGMQVAPAEKGLAWVRINAKGLVGQGMLVERGSAATARLADVLGQIDKWNDTIVPAPMPVLDHSDNLEGMRLTANIGRIGGGEFYSTAASSAWAEVDFRVPPGLSIAEIHSRLDGICSDDNLSWKWVKGWEANWSQPDAPVVKAVRSAAAKVRGKQPAYVTRLPASDASRWRQLGVPAVCFGPQPELASGVDDYVNRSDFFDCCDIYSEALLVLLGR